MHSSLKVLKIAVLLASSGEKDGTNKTFLEYTVETAKFLSQAFGVPYELMTPADGQFGKLRADGNWTGMIGMLQRGEADVITHMLFITEERTKALSYSPPFHFSEVTFAMQHEEHISGYTAFLKPFSYNVWISVLLCLILTPFIFYVLARRRSFWKLVWNCFATFLLKTLMIRPKKLSEYFLVASWIIGITFLTYSYSALLLSFMVLPPLTGIQTISELSAAVTKGTHHCVAKPGTSLTGTILNSPDPLIRVLGRSLEQNAGTNDMEMALAQRTQYKKAAFIDIKDDFACFGDRYFISKDVFFSTPLAIAARKDFCCKKELNKIISYMFASGISSKVVDKYFFELSLKSNLKATVKDSTENTPIKLTIDDFKGAFALLVSGHILGIFVFAAEVIFQSVAHLRNKNGKRRNAVVK